MREIVANQLWIGNAFDIRPFRSPSEIDIHAVVDLAIDEPVAQIPRDIVYFRMPLVDGANNASEMIRLVISSTAGLIRDGIGTIICCSAGMSRSPAVAASAIAVANGEDATGVLERLFGEVPHDISPALWNDLLEAVATLK